MRILTASEQEKVSGGLVFNSRSESPMTPPRSPIMPVQGDDDKWYVTPMIGSNELSYGLSVSGGFDAFSANPKSASYTVDNALSDVNLALALSSSGVTTGTASLPDVGGTDFTLKGSIASNGQQTGTLQFSENGLTANIGGSASAWSAGIQYTDGPYTGTASYNSGSDSYSVSITGADIMNLFGTPISCTFDVFGLGGSDPGAGLECWAGGKPPSQPEAVGVGAGLHSPS